MNPISRREFGALMAAGLVGGRFPADIAHARVPEVAITASEIIERIRGNIGVAWNADTVDTVKAGDPATLVTGVVTTAMATVDVLRQAIAGGANLVITAEPTFYGRADSRTPRAGGPGAGAPPGAAPASDAPPPPDAVYTAKNELIDANDVVIFRLSDHWRARRPDPFAVGMAQAMGWSRSVEGEMPRYDIQPVTLEAFASELKRRLNARGGIRVVGDLRIQVGRVALLPGTTAITASLAAMPISDVVVAGEVREWESVEYARDVVHSGQPRGMVLLGRVLSEDPGMAECARWLGSIVSEVPVRHISAGDPYWRPVA